MRTATTLLQSESTVVFMVMNEIRAPHDKMKGIVTDVTNLKQPVL